MSDVTIDREMLESFSTSEIRRILREDYDDYTPEAIDIFKDILESRGDADIPPVAISTPGSGLAQKKEDRFTGSCEIYNPRDAINFLNSLLSGVMNDTIAPEKAAVGVEIVLAILKANEAALMTESEEY